MVLTPKTFISNKMAQQYTTRHSTNTVCNLFHKVILGFRDIPQLARLLDIMVPDFLLWGYLKERVYRTHNHTAQEMERAIQYEIALINQDHNLLQ